MVLEGVSITWSELLAIIIGIPTAITIPLTIFLTKIKGQGEQNHNCIERLEKKMDENKLSNEKANKDLELKIEQVSTAVTAIHENVAESREVHKELRDETRELKQFVIDWNQRIEDLLRDQRSAGLSVNIPKGATMETTNTGDYSKSVEKRLDLIEKILMKFVDQKEKDRYHNG